MKRILAVLVLCLPLLAAAKPSEKPQTESQKLAAVLAEYDRLELDHEPALRIQRGLDVEKLPEFSFEAAQRDARALRALRERLALVDPQRLTHEEWLSREILDWQLATYAEGAEHFWDFFQLTPYAAPFRSPLHQVFTSFTFRTEKDWQRYLDLLQQYVRVVASSGPTWKPSGPEAFFSPRRRSIRWSLSSARSCGRPRRACSRWTPSGSRSFIRKAQPRSRGKS